MLQIENLTKRFGDVTAVDKITLGVPSGEMIGVIGRSGAGKSTLLRMINRLVDPSGGRIVHGEREVGALNGKALRDWRAECAMIFQQFNLVKRLDVITNVLVGRLAYRPLVSSLLMHFTPAERALAVRCLERVDIAELALQRADTLSGGQQQRVAIARALCQQPRLILADEPIASLDPRSARMVMDTLARINRADGITVVVNLHDLDAAKTYCRRIVGMRGGAVVFDGPPERLTPAAVASIYGTEIDADDAPEGFSRLDPALARRAGDELPHLLVH
ncbi:MAG: phosphonate ABC transporter ATP-binding protein [Azospirillum sp.]|nr:phosphonate ABC transporter ATP-binding protein [Azospirillum sp.]